MSAVGIRELKEHTSEIIRRVRENNQSYDITYHGEVVARLIPVEKVEEDEAEIASWFTTLEALQAELRVLIPIADAVEMIKEARREL